MLGGGGRYHVVYNDDGVEEWLLLPSLDVHLVPAAGRHAPLPALRFWEPGDAVLSRRPSVLERPAAAPAAAEVAVYPARVVAVDGAGGRVQVRFDEHVPAAGDAGADRAAAGGDAGADRAGVVEMALEQVRQRAGSEGGRAAQSRRQGTYGAVTPGTGDVRQRGLAEGAAGGAWMLQPRSRGWAVGAGGGGRWGLWVSKRGWAGLAGRGRGRGSWAR